jgi:hypothetical protein
VTFKNAKTQKQAKTVDVSCQKTDLNFTVSERPSSTSDVSRHAGVVVVVVVVPVVVVVW